MLVIIGAIAAVASNRVSVISDSLATINDVDSVKQRFAINFCGSVHDRAISLRDVVLVQTSQERDAALAEIARLAAFYADSATQLDRIMASGQGVTPQEGAILASIRATEARTMPMVARVIEAKGRNDAAQAQRILLEEARPAFIEWLARINQFIDLQEEKNRTVGAMTRGVAESFQWLTLGMVAAALLLGAAIAAWSMRAIAPLRRLADAMLRLSRGDLTAEIPGEDRRDEVGAMARAVAIFKTGMAQSQQLAAEQERLKHSAEQDRQATLRALLQNLEKKVGGTVALLADRSGVLESTARSMRGTAAQTDQKAGSVQTAATAANERVQGVAAAAERLTASIADISSKVAQWARITNGAVEDAQRANGIVQALAGGAQRTGDVVGLITSIADQTNLLALNATQGIATSVQHTVDATRQVGADIEGVTLAANETGSAAEQVLSAAIDLSRQAETLAQEVRGFVKSVEVA